MECKLKSSVLGPWFPRDMRKRDVEISDPFGHFLPMAFLPLSNVCSPNLVYFPEYTLWACHIISVFLIYCCLWPHSFSFSFRTSDPCYWHLPFSGILPYHSMGFSTGSFFLPIVIPNGLHSINSQHLPLIVFLLPPVFLYNTLISLLGSEIFIFLLWACLGTNTGV